MAFGQNARERLSALPLSGIAKGARWLAVLVMTGVVLTAAVAGWLIYSSLPTRTGTLNIDGLAAPVEIARDPRGVPHIFAVDLHDATFALGFIHAQDRLWQMEAMRRFASGRLSEVAGPRTLKTDRMMRTFGFQRLVEAQFQRLSVDARRSLTRYAEGVNAWLLEHRGALPPEFQVLRYTPEPWRPTDSLLWIKTMAMRLSGNFRDEIARARLEQRLGRDRTDAFWYPDITPVQTADTAPTVDATVADAMLDVLGDVGAAPLGASNAWAVTGRRSGTGSAILANDPHLGYAAPGLWYVARIETPDGIRIGATAPGVPFLILGHNGRMAWGLTTTQTDQQDVFVERVGDDPSTYLTPSGFKSFDTRREVIGVKGADDVELTIRTTERGPVISDLLDPADVEAADPGGNQAGRVLSLRAAFLDAIDTTPEALFRLGRAETISAFETALSLVHAPQQNVVFASTAGEIGFVAAGAVALRGSRTGRYPARGWALDDQWRGYVPFADLPRAITPAGGRIVTANNRIVGPDYPYFITDDWAPPYRARRIFEVMGDRPQSLDTTAEIQRDPRSLMATELLPFLLAVEPRSKRERAAQILLSGWRGDMIRRRPEPLLFYAWLRHLNRLIYADDLGPLFDRFWSLRPRFIHRVLTRDRAWCDDIGTDERETCKDMAARALTQSLAELAAVHDSGIVRWRWGDDHHARFRHPLFSGIPILSNWADLRIDVDGGNYTINRAAVRVRDAQRPFDAVHGPGYRAIYDLADLNRSRFMMATGASGNMFSPNYDNMLEDWRNGLYFRLDLPRAVLHGAEKTRTLTLIPTGLETRFRGDDAPDPDSGLDGVDEEPPAAVPGPASVPDTTFGASETSVLVEPPPVAPAPGETLSDPFAAPGTGSGVDGLGDLIQEPIIEGDPFGAIEPAPGSVDETLPPPPEPESTVEVDPSVPPPPEPALPADDGGLFDLEGLPGDDEPLSESEVPQAEPLPEVDPLPGAVSPPDGPTPIDPENVDQIEDSINDLMRSITESLDPLQE